MNRTITRNHGAIVWRPYSQILLLTAMILGAGCGTSIEQVSNDDKKKSWQLRLLETGGWAGVRRELWLNSRGQWKFTDKKRQLSRSGSGIEKTLLQSIETRVSEVLKSPAEKGHLPGIGACRDCFMYRITLMQGAHIRSIYSSEYGFDYSKEAKTLLKLLLKLLNQQTSFITIKTGHPDSERSRGVVRCISQGLALYSSACYVRFH